MSDHSDDRTASLMTPAKLAQLQVKSNTAASPAAWLDQLASDAGSGHVRRLIDLARQLESQMREGSSSEGVREALKALRETLEKLDFSLLQPKGWLARATGKGKEEAAGFVAQVERIARAGEDFADEVRALQKKHQAQATASDRTIFDCDAEVRALDKIMEQGARWLQDMRSQLKSREAEGGDAAAQQQLREDTARCELLVVRIKQLRAATSATQQAVERSKAMAKSRRSLTDSLQQALDGEWQAWQKKGGPLAEAVAASGSASKGVEAARHALGQLQEVLKQARKDCRTLEGQEQALGEELAALHAPLQAAA
jgi:chromosome segregation ATPase